MILVCERTCRLSIRISISSAFLLETISPIFSLSFFLPNRYEVKNHQENVHRDSNDNNETNNDTVKNKNIENKNLT